MEEAILGQKTFRAPQDDVGGVMVRVNHCPGLHVPLHETREIFAMLALNLVDDRNERGPAIEAKTPLDVFRELTLAPLSCHLCLPSLASSISHAPGKIRQGFTLVLMYSA